MGWHQDGDAPSASQASQKLAKTVRSGHDDHITMIMISPLISMIRIANARVEARVVQPSLVRMVPKKHCKYYRFASVVLWTATARHAAK